VHLFIKIVFTSSDNYPDAMEFENSEVSSQQRVALMVSLANMAAWGMVIFY
jgi:hypothetical protein